MSAPGNLIHSGSGGCQGERQADREAREVRAKAVCGGCPVRLECLEYAQSRPEVAGTWGGLGEAERLKDRRKRTRAARTAVA